MTTLLKPLGSTLGVAAAAMLALAAPALAGYQPVRNWEMRSPQSIAVSGAGEVFVATSPSGGNHGVLRYSSRGRLVKRWGSTGEAPGQLRSPFGIAVDPKGNVHVTDITNRIQIFRRGGELLNVSDLGLSAFDIDIDAKGDRYLAHNGTTYGELPNGVLRFNAAGTNLARWGSEGGGNGQFESPQGIASDGRGNVYVVDAANDRVQRFTDSGRFVRGWGQTGSGRAGLRGPRGVAVNRAGDVFVADTSNYRVKRYRPDGRLVEIIRLPKNGPYRPKPWDLDFDRKGNLYVLDRESISAGYVSVLRPSKGR